VLDGAADIGGRDSGYAALADDLIG
jgi:hypothetical protein